MRIEAQMEFAKSLLHLDHLTSTTVFSLKCIVTLSN